MPEYATLKYYLFVPLRARRVVDKADYPLPRAQTKAHFGPLRIAARGDTPMSSPLIPKEVVPDFDAVCTFIDSLPAEGAEEVGDFFRRYAGLHASSRRDLAQVESLKPELMAFARKLRAADAVTVEDYLRDRVYHSDTPDVLEAARTDFSKFDLRRRS